MVKEDILAFMRELHLRSKHSKRIGVTFIALNLKKEGIDIIKDFRPISLIGSIYKILAKVLATRIQKVLPDIISKSQGALAQGR